MGHYFVSLLLCLVHSARMLVPFSDATYRYVVGSLKCFRFERSKLLLLLLLLLLLANPRTIQHSLEKNEQRENLVMFWVPSFGLFTVGSYSVVFVRVYRKSWSKWICNKLKLSICRSRGKIKEKEKETPMHSTSDGCTFKKTTKTTKTPATLSAFGWVSQSDPD